MEDSRDTTQISFPNFKTGPEDNPVIEWIEAEANYLEEVIASFNCLLSLRITLNRAERYILPQFMFIHTDSLFFKLQQHFFNHELHVQFPVLQLKQRHLKY